MNVSSRLDSGRRYSYFSVVRGLWSNEIVLSCLANVRGGALKEWRGRSKRRMPSLSIDLPMAVLRQKLSLEQSRHDHAVQAAANRNFLNDIGKRGEHTDECRNGVYLV